MQLTFLKYNFTYLSQFQALGLQGEASYWFAGNIQTTVSPFLLLSLRCCCQQVCMVCCNRCSAHQQELLAAPAWLPA